MQNLLQPFRLRCLLLAAAALAGAPAHSQGQPQPSARAQMQSQSQGQLQGQVQGQAQSDAQSQVQSQARPASEPMLAASAADAFYDQLGGREGVAAIVAEFVTIMLADKRIADTFEGVDMDRLHAKLAEQFCLVSGGPCSYTGKSMQEVHEDLKVNNARFNASVEDLQLAMTRRGVPSRVQNRLLAKLAPTQRAIVTQ